jgi:predicted DNA-binding protein YlxM (UPF0122 family)
MRIEHKLWENQNKIWEEIKKFREEQNRIWEEIKKICKKIKRLRKEIKLMQKEQRRFRIIFEKLTPPIEEEARDVISYRLSRELGIEIKLDRLLIKGREINIYGAVEDICVIGEASVKLRPKIVKEMEEKIELLRKYKPELLRPKLIKVIYTDVAFPNGLKLASKNNIWVLNWKEDLLPMKIIQ